MREELDEFLSPSPCLTLGDMGRNRKSRSPHLRIQTKPFITGEGTRHCVNLLGQAHTLLPDKKIPITLDPGVSVHIVPLRTAGSYWPLATNH